MTTARCSTPAVERTLAGVTYSVDSRDAHRVAELDRLPVRGDVALWVPLDHGLRGARQAVLFWPELGRLRTPSGANPAVGAVTLDPGAVGAELRSLVLDDGGCCYGSTVLLSTVNGTRGVLTRVHAADGAVGLGDLVLREEYDPVPAPGGPRDLVGRRGHEREVEALRPRGLLAGGGALHVLWENHGGLGRVWERVTGVDDLRTGVRHACLDVPVYVRHRDPQTARGTAFPRCIADLDSGLSALRYDPTIRGL